MAQKPYFDTQLFDFLRELRENNNREWFKARKARFEEVLRDPLLRFVGDVGPRLEKLSPYIIADPRPVGGSVFRIYRDTRFSKDKTPYKTNLGAHFKHAAGKNVHTPGYYLHLEPGNVFAGSGIWRPDGKTLAKIRDAIVEDPAAWKKVITRKSFAGGCTLSGDKLKRPPRGYDKDHPYLEDLKRKDFVTFTNFTEKEACAPDFITRFVKVCRTAAPFMKFIADAIDVDW